jgi:hypothetical protein
LPSDPADMEAMVAGVKLARLARRLTNAAAA